MRPADLLGKNVSEMNRSCDEFGAGTSINQAISPGFPILAKWRCANQMFSVLDVFDTRENSLMLSSYYFFLVQFTMLSDGGYSGWVF